MRIIEFLQMSIDGQLTLVEQKKYLKENSFPSSGELAEAVKYLRSQMPPTPNLADAIDICGTGGSGLPRINTSTISAFLLAAAGVPVAKHGNNASSGRFGSFDLLNGLDVPIKLSNQELQLRFNQYKLAFLYAKDFHPAMRHFAAVRAELKIPTFFNILGPLLSPVDAKKQLIGTSNLENARLIAKVAKRLGKKRVIVVSGADGLDEVTLFGVTHVVELANDKITEYEVSPADFGIKPATDFSEIASSSGEENVQIALNILTARDKSRRLDLVLINSAMAFYLTDKVKNLASGYKLAKKILQDGAAYKTLEDYRRPSFLSKISNQKRSFNVSANTKHSRHVYNGGLIAEIKKRSPSEGDIAPDKDILKLAKDYELAGASAISVLTEPTYFGGSFDDLKKIRQTVKLPILCKDFITTKPHIDAAKAAGADIILLIASMLSLEKLKELFDYASGLKLQVLIEVHNQSDLDKALFLNPEMIGINSRNLHDFSLNPNVLQDLKEKIPKRIKVIAESGISNYSDHTNNFDGILVGTVLMKHPFPKLKIKELTGKPLLKLCGIRAKEQAALCEKLGVDMIGINLVPRSRRKVTLQQAKDIASQCVHTITVGVFENQSAKEVNLLAKRAGVKAIQLSGQEDNLTAYELPIIKTIQLGQPRPKEAFLTILDSKIPGSGKAFAHGKLNLYEPSLIAGGITLDMAKKLRDLKQPLGFDTASGVETNGEVDLDKIKAFAKMLPPSLSESFESLDAHRARANRTPQKSSLEAKSEGGAGKNVCISLFKGA